MTIWSICICILYVSLHLLSSVCPLTCQNGGTLNGTTCTCAFADGYAGYNCESANQHHSCLWEDSCKHQHCDCQQVGYHYRVMIECGLYAVLTLYCCSVKVNSYVHPFTNTGSQWRWSWCAVYNHAETANLLYTIHACLQVNVTVFWSRQTVVLHSGCSFNVLQLQKGASHVHPHITANVIMHLSFVGVWHQSAHMQYSWYTGMYISMYTITLYCVYSTEDDICIDILALSLITLFCFWLAEY